MYGDSGRCMGLVVVVWGEWSLYGVSGRCMGWWSLYEDSGRCMGLVVVVKVMRLK